MKRTFAKRGIMSLVAGFFLFGFMLLSAVRVEAQANWVSSDEAKLRLLQAINEEHLVIGASQPGQPAYENAMVAAIYYKAIYVLINDGISVDQAVGQGINALATGRNAGFTPNQYVASSSSQGLVSDATDLLTDN
jgi:hypothetical protein